MRVQSSAGALLSASELASPRRRGNELSEEPQTKGANGSAPAAPSEGSGEGAQSPAESPFLAYATPGASVSAFVRATLDNVVPNAFWGNGEAQLENKQLLMRKVDHFISQRRFESISLHDILQGFKVSIFENTSWQI